VVEEERGAQRNWEVDGCQVARWEKRRRGRGKKRRRQRRE